MQRSPSFDLKPCRPLGALPSTHIVARISIRQAGLAEHCVLVGNRMRIIRRDGYATINESLFDARGARRIWERIANAPWLEEFSLHAPISHGEFSMSPGVEIQQDIV
jgi:hypothetical protein